MTRQQIRWKQTIYTRHLTNWKINVLIPLKSYGEYDKIKKKKEYENTVTHFTLEPRYTIGNAPFPESDYDKITIIMICLSKGDTIHEEKDIIRFLGVLLNMNMPLEERRQILEKDYDIKMNEEMEQEVEEMCSIGEMIALENLELGRSQGISQGFSQSHEQFALLMLRDGEPLDKIMRYTDYSFDQLEDLARKNGMTIKH